MNFRISTPIEQQKGSCLLIDRWNSFMVKTFAFERDVLPTIVVYKQLMESKERSEGMRLCNAETDNFKLPFFFPSVDRQQFAWLALLRSAPGISRHG